MLQCCNVTKIRWYDVTIFQSNDVTNPISATMAWKWQETRCHRVRDTSNEKPCVLKWRTEALHTRSDKLIVTWKIENDAARNGTCTHALTVSSPAVAGSATFGSDCTPVTGSYPRRGVRCDSAPTNIPPVYLRSNIPTTPPVHARLPFISFTHSCAVGLCGYRLALL
jgi:hypothetical protein